MTTNTVKHTPPMTPTEKHRETARSVLGDWMVGEHPQLVGIFASALAKAEREGMKRAADVLAIIEPDEGAAGGTASWGDFVQVAQSALLSEAGECV